MTLSTKWSIPLRRTMLGMPRRDPRSGGGARNGTEQAEHLVYSRRRSWLCGRVLLWPPGLHDAEHRPPRCRRRAFYASLRQFGSVHRLARGVDDWAISVQVGGRPGGAVEQPSTTQARPAARSPDPALDPEGDGVPDRTDRQMAFGHAARIRPVAERLRALLRHLQRRS